MCAGKRRKTPADTLARTRILLAQTRTVIAGVVAEQGPARVAVTKVGADRLAADFHAGDEDDLVVGQLRLDVCTYLDSENRIVDAQMRIIVVAEHHVSAVGVHAGMARDDPAVLEVDVFDEDLLAGAQRLDVVADLFAVDSGGERQRIDRKRRQTVRRLMDADITLALAPRGKIFHFLGGTQMSVGFETLDFLVREELLIRRYFVLRLVQTCEDTELDIARIVADRRNRAESQIDPAAVHLMFERHQFVGNTSFEDVAHALIVQQDLLVQAQRLNLIPRKFPFLELIAVGELGDTPLVVEFVVGDLFGQRAVLILAFADLDDGVEDTVEFFGTDPKETSAQVGRASVLVAKVLEKGSQNRSAVERKGSAPIARSRAHGVELSRLLVHLADQTQIVRLFVEDGQHVLR